MICSVRRCRDSDRTDKATIKQKSNFALPHCLCIITLYYCCYIIIQLKVGSKRVNQSYYLLHAHCPFYSVKAEKLFSIMKGKNYFIVHQQGYIHTFLSRLNKDYLTLI